jgi:hypothetical protein
MNWNRNVAIAITALFLVTGPASAQRGIEVGVGVGNQTKVGAGRGAGVGVGSSTQTGVGIQTGKATVEVGADADVNVAASRSKRKAAARIESNDRLAAKVQSMLPADVSIRSAADGFKNEGQFLSAVHASQNLEVPFDQLKVKMTGEAAMSLESAIRASKPELSEKEAKEVAKKAEAEAKASASLK